MNVLLLERIQNLGELGDEVSVKNGYARNFLIPRHKALRATPENREIFEQRRQDYEKAAIRKLEDAERRAAELDGQTLVILARVAEEDRLYGSVGALEISKEITRMGIPVHKSEVQLPDGPIRLVGEYSIKINVHADLTVSISLLVQGAA